MKKEEKHTYEKKYKEALERATKVKNNASLSNGTLRVLEIIFPELKESKDEMIKKELISFVNNDGWKFTKLTKEEKESWIAWLKKQGNKQKKASIWKHWKDGIAGGSESEQIFLIKIGNVYSISSCLGCECDYIELSELDKLMQEEKQGKSKWTEEDDTIRCEIIKRMEALDHYWNRPNDQKLIDWIKSLKQRIEQ